MNAFKPTPTLTVMDQRTAGAITNRENGWIAGAGVQVCFNAILGFQTSFTGQFSVRDDTNPHQNQVGGDGAPIRQRHS